MHIAHSILSLIPSIVLKRPIKPDDKVKLRGIAEDPQRAGSETKMILTY